MSALLLVGLLRQPARAGALTPEEWNGVIAAARAERLLATLAVRLEEEAVALPVSVSAIMADARFDAERERRQALWESDRAAAALVPLGIPVILMKGTAYAAANVRASRGRLIGDLDIMIPRERLDEAEAALIDAGWEWVKPDPYDDAYYRQWMHELPPLIHRDRDRMIDVHHTILPLTARPKPDAASMLANRVDIGGGLSVLSPEDRICHAVAHLLADGDLSGGLRNLWDIKCLLDDIEDVSQVEACASHHGLAPYLARARRLASTLYGDGNGAMTLTDRLFLRRLLSTNGWGQDGRKFTSFAFYIRSHYLRMPPFMLARHLWTKWRKGYRPV